MRHALAVAVLVGSVGPVATGRAQAPATAPDAATIRSPRGASALAVMQQWAADIAAQQAAGATLHANGVLPRGLDQCGYAMTSVMCRGESTTPTSGMPFGPSTAWGVYLFCRDDDTEPVFFLTPDLPLLWSANRTTRYGGGKLPAPDAALAQGADRTWAARQRTGGIGQDGELWQLVDTIPTATLTVVVRDTKGAPVPDAVVQLEPATAGSLRRPFGGRPAKGLTAFASPPVPLAAAAPAGSATIGADGRGSVRGASVRGLGVRVLLADAELVVAAGRVTLRGDTLEVSVEPPPRMRDVELVTFTMLRNLASGQSQCQASGVIDVDGDGVGEYGFFAELAGACDVRRDANGGVGGSRIAPPILATNWAPRRDAATASAGYLFRMFLPDRAGRWVTEHATGFGGRGVAVDPAAAELRWCALAWPARAGWTGQRAFFVDASGNVLEHANADGAWSGAAAPAPWTTPAPPPGWTIAAPPAPMRGR